MSREEFFKIQPEDKRTEEQYQAALSMRRMFDIPDSMSWPDAKNLIMKCLDIWCECDDYEYDYGM